MKPSSSTYIGPSCESPPSLPPSLPNDESEPDILVLQNLRTISSPELLSLQASSARLGYTTYLSLPPSLLPSLPPALQQMCASFPTSRRPARPPSLPPSFRRTTVAWLCW